MNARYRGASRFQKRIGLVRVARTGEKSYCAHTESNTRTVEKIYYLGAATGYVRNPNQTISIKLYRISVIDADETKCT